MGREDRLLRRELLRTIGPVTLGLATAGCNSFSEDDAPTTPTDSPTPTPTETFITDEHLRISTSEVQKQDSLSATLVGDLTSIEARGPATVGFEYWTSDSGNKQYTDAGALPEPRTFDTEIQGLVGASEYTFRAVGETEYTEDTGSNLTFTTDPAWQPRNPPDELLPSEVVGSTHVSGTYHFTDEDFLNEGAKKLASIGTDVIKLWFHRMNEAYPYNSDWKDEYESMVGVARTQYVREVFDRSFSTYVLLAHSYHGGPWTTFQDGLTTSDIEDLENRFEALTRHLLETYDGTGKTFVLQNWEGDNLAQSGDESEPLPDDIAENFRQWLSARQTGVERARDAVESDVKVLHAAEVNYVLDAKNSGTARVINEVIPETNVDLVSYSAWEMGDQLAGEGWAPGHNGEKQFDEAETIVTETLDYIDAQAPDPNDYVVGSLTDRQSNVYLGEFGSPFQQQGKETAMKIIRSVLEHSLNWGVRWVLYWELYCNEKTVEGEVTDNDDVRGFYLVRPDGTPAPSLNYISSVLNRDEQY